METATSASGSKTKLMAMVSTSGPTVTNMRENGTSAYATVKAQISFPTVTSISVSTLMARPMVTGNIAGRMETPILAFSSRA